MRLHISKIAKTEKTINVDDFAIQKLETYEDFSFLAVFKNPEISGFKRSLRLGI